MLSLMLNTITKINQLTKSRTIKNDSGISPDISPNIYSSTIDVLEDQNHNLITDEVTKSSMLNNFFLSVLTQEPPFTHPDVDPPVQTSTILNNLIITPQMVEHTLSKIKANKACGPDGCHVNALKNVPNLSVPLSIIFNTSIRISQIPQDWRDANNVTQI